MGTMLEVQSLIMIFDSIVQIPFRYPKTPVRSNQLFVTIAPFFDSIIVCSCSVSIKHIKY